MKYFVCSDIHGFYKEWRESLKKVGFDINNPEHKIVVCGDLFDRGREPKEIIKFILNHKDKFILIKGNHEELMERMIRRNKPSMADITNGTSDTIFDLYPKWKMGISDLSKISKKTGLDEVLSMCVDYFETEHFIFVHGWIPTTLDDEYDPNWRNADRDAWKRARWQNPVEMYRNEVFEPNKKIVCGHWNCSALWHEENPEKYDEYGENANFEPFVCDDMIALDACTVYTRKVNDIELED